MPLRTGRTRAGSPPAKARREPTGHVRRAQQISTYGVGSLVAVGEQSFIVGGLDSWKDDRNLEILEPRLQRALGVAGFRLPPADVPSSGDGINIRRFPDWYSCRNCGDLQPYRKFGATGGRCNGCNATLTPSRFVVACTDGHIDDFPYWLWVHKGKQRTEGVRHDLQLHSTGQTASLRAIVITCSCGEEASLEGAFGKSALSQLGIRCTGARPWLGRSASEPDCPQSPRTLQRGSSAAWFPLIRSALSIPPWSERVQRAIAPFYDMWVGESDDTILRQAGNNAKFTTAGYKARQILDAVRRRERLMTSTEEVDRDSGAHGSFEAAHELRREEYRQLCNTTPESSENADFVCVPVVDPGASPPVGIGLTMLVKRLREVRALTGFVRVDVPMPVDPKSRRAVLAGEAVQWLPAIEVIGEGVFLRLDMQRLHDWEKQLAVIQRADLIRRRHEEALAQRLGSGPAHSSVIPRVVLAHSLAHVLINEWSLDAGYPAGALSERLYVDDDEMTGVLIYTATSDSAGSLGGVLAQGAPEKLTATLHSALARASWCSADPLCMESEASGTDSLNLAACHACLLLPETSCELNNTILDRAMLVGTPDAASIGYFRDE
jgi:Domain of unknown function (DUF1998)